MIKNISKVMIMLLVISFVVSISIPKVSAYYGLGGYGMYGLYGGMYGMYGLGGYGMYGLGGLFGLGMWGW